MTWLRLFLRLNALVFFVGSMWLAYKGDYTTATYFVATAAYFRIHILDQP